MGKGENKGYEIEATVKSLELKEQNIKIGILGTEGYSVKRKIADHNKVFNLFWETPTEETLIEEAPTNKSPSDIGVKARNSDDEMDIIVDSSNFPATSGLQCLTRWAAAGKKVKLRLDDKLTKLTFIKLIS